MFEEYPLDQPEPHQDQAVGLGDGERPGDPVHVVKELVGQRRAHGLVWDPLVDDGDDHGGEDEVEDGVEEGHARFPPLVGEVVGALLGHGDLGVVAAALQPAQRLHQGVLLQQSAQATAAPAFAVVVIWGGRAEAARAAVGDPLRRGGSRRAGGGCVEFHGEDDVTVVLDPF